MPKSIFLTPPLLLLLTIAISSCSSSEATGTGPAAEPTLPAPSGSAPAKPASACPGECTAGATESTACVWDAKPKTRTCSAACAWGAWTECAKPQGWRTIASSQGAGITARFGHEAFWTGKEMLVFGGSSGGGPIVSSWGAYDPSLNTWRKLPAPPASIAPGLDGPAKPVLGDDVLFVSFSLGGAIFDLKTETWSDVPSATASTPLEKRGPAVVVWSAATKEFILWGGGRNNCPCSLADGAAYAPATKTWRKLAASPLAPRDYYYRPSAVVAGGKVIIYGGGTSEGARYRDAAAYDPMLDTWTKLPDPPSSLDSYNAFSHPLGTPPTRMLIWAGSQLSGGNTQNYPTNSGAIWDTATDTWSPISGPANERPVDGFSGGATFIAGDVLYAWGGTRYFKVSSTGYAYDTKSHAWSAMAPGGPSPRSKVTAVWTGSEAIVWGGADAANKPLADGAIWRP